VKKQQQRVNNPCVCVHNKIPARGAKRARVSHPYPFVVRGFYECDSPLFKTGAERAVVPSGGFIYHKIV